MPIPRQPVAGDLSLATSDEGPSDPHGDAHDAIADAIELGAQASDQRGVINVSELPPVRHVSPTGDDTFDGRPDRPLLTAQAAIDSLPALGGEVRPRPGNYPLTVAGGPLIPKKGLVFRASGGGTGGGAPRPAATFIAGAGMHTLWDGTGVDDVTFEGAGIVFDAAAIADAVFKASRPAGGETAEVVIEDLAIRAHMGVGAIIGGNGDDGGIHVRRGYINASSTAPATSRGMDILSNDDTVEGMRFFGYKQVAIKDRGGSRISGCHFQGLQVGPGAAAGIWVAAGGGHRLFHNWADWQLGGPALLVAPELATDVIEDVHVLGLDTVGNNTDGAVPVIRVDNSGAAVVDLSALTTTAVGVIRALAFDNIMGHGNDTHRFSNIFEQYGTISGLTKLRHAGVRACLGPWNVRPSVVHDVSYATTLTGMPVQQVNHLYKSGGGVQSLSDADYAYTPSNGEMGFAYDSTADRLFMCSRANGTWRSVEMT